MPWLIGGDRGSAFLLVGITRWNTSIPAARLTGRGNKHRLSPLRLLPRSPTPESAMSRIYDVIDADGHVLEPFTLWNDYLDPAYRDRAPKLVKDQNGKERLLLEEQILGSTAGFGGIGGIGARQGIVSADAMEYKDGRKGGFDPHARIPDMDLDGIDAAFLYP